MTQNGCQIDCEAVSDLSTYLLASTLSRAFTTRSCREKNSSLYTLSSVAGWTLDSWASIHRSVHTQEMGLQIPPTPHFLFFFHQIYYSLQPVYWPTAFNVSSLVELLTWVDFQRWFSCHNWLWFLTGGEIKKEVSTAWNRDPSHSYTFEVTCRTLSPETSRIRYI